MTPRQTQNHHKNRPEGETSILGLKKVTDEGRGTSAFVEKTLQLTKKEKSKRKQRFCNGKKITLIKLNFKKMSKGFIKGNTKANYFQESIHRYLEKSKYPFKMINISKEQKRKNGIEICIGNENLNTFLLEKKNIFPRFYLTELSYTFKK